MAVLKQRMNRKNAAGEYDTVHMETSADIVLMSDGTTKLSDKIAAMDAKIDAKNDNLFGGSFVPNGILVPFAGYQWLVCHSDQNYVYMILNSIYETVVFGTNTTYAGSTLAAKCTTFMNKTFTAAQQEMLGSIAVSGVTAKVFIPTYAQINGGFTYFDNAIHRDAYHTKIQSTKLQSYWTSTKHPTGTDNVRTYCGGINNGEGVDYNTGFAYSNIASQSGFRPCIAYKR